MARNRTPDEEALKYVVHTRLAESKYNELVALHSKTVGMDFSTMLRDIIHNRKIKVFTYDQSLDMVMQELTRLRTELKAIGININQITRHFNTYPEESRKQYYARIAFDRYLLIDGKVEQLLTIIAELSKKWLSK